MIAFNGLSSQIIQLPNVPVARGKNSITAACWFKHTVALAATTSFWRNNCVLTGLQYDVAAPAFRPAFWQEDNTLLNVPTVATYAVAANQWTFCIAQYNRTGIRAYAYVPGSAAVQGGSTITWASGITRNPIAINPMCIGGTEGNIELAPSGTFLAELMILGTAIPVSAIPQLAHEPHRFAKDLLFYAPLRSAAARTVEAGGESYAFSYGTDSRALISESGHPPVEKWRPRTQVLVGDTFASRLRAADTLRVTTSTSTPLIMGMR